MDASVARAPDVALEELSGALWQVRRLLDLLRFRLEEEQLLARAGGRRWLPTARREVEAVQDRLRLAELVRAVSTEQAAAALGVGSPATLRELARTAPEPWAHILGAHLEALEEVVRSITELADATRRWAEETPTEAPPAVRVGPSLEEFLGRA